MVLQNQKNVKTPRPMCSTPASLPLLDEGADRTLHPLRGPSGEVNVLRLRRKAIASDGKRPLLQETIPCLRSRPYILHILHTRGNKKYQKGRYTIYIYISTSPSPHLTRPCLGPPESTSEERRKRNSATCCRTSLR